MSVFDDLDRRSRASRDAFERTLLADAVAEASAEIQREYERTWRTVVRIATQAADKGQRSIEWATKMDTKAFYLVLRRARVEGLRATDTTPPRPMAGERVRWYRLKVDWPSERGQH